MLYEHRQGPIPRVEGPKDLEILYLPEGDLRLLSAIREVSDAKRAQFDKRLRRGDRCVLARLGADPVHFSWVQRGGRHGIQDAGRVVELSPKEACIFDCVTAPRARGLRIYPAVLVWILNQLDPSIDRVLIYTTKSNVASQRGIHRAGFVHLRDFRALDVNGRHLRPRSLPIYLAKAALRRVRGPREAP